jgi:hypothetical protein
MNPAECPNKITKPPVWDGQGPYKDCRATDDDDEERKTVVWVRKRCSLIKVSSSWNKQVC